MEKTVTQNNLSQFLKKINQSIKLEKNVPMAQYTTFNTGGNADLFFTPKNIEELIEIKKVASLSKVPIFILGLGANLLVSDKGIREPVIYLKNLSEIKLENQTLSAQCGATIEELTQFALEQHQSGLEFLSGLPSSVGGAVWMNARCYGNSISDILESVDYIDEEGKIKKLIPTGNDFAYKKSPFQKKEWTIISAIFKITQADPKDIKSKMEEKKADRKSKGHYRYPCAGSIFKNNRKMGSPSGKIIDSIGLRGKRIGNAAISDFHANIIINLGGAKSKEIQDLIIETKNTVKNQLGFELEPEVLLVGDWD